MTHTRKHKIRKPRVKKNKGRKSRKTYRKSHRKTYRKGGCNQCVGSDYKADEQWTSGPMKGGGQNEDYSNYMLDPIPYSVS